MLNNLKMEGLIESAIFKEHKIKEWNEYKINIMKNISNINFNEKIENYYIPPGKSLHVTRSRMRIIMYGVIKLNSNIFEEIGYCSYKAKVDNIKDIDIYNFIEECVKILVKKQYLKI